MAVGYVAHYSSAIWRWICFPDHPRHPLMFKAVAGGQGCGMEDNEAQEQIQ